MEAVLLNGTVGAGKTSTAEALSTALSERGVRHGVIDVDQVRRLHPAPPGDPFQHAVAVANLRDLAANYGSAGAERLVLAGVVETAADLQDYRGALPGLLHHVLLTVRPEIGAARLQRRHAEDAVARQWHLDRAGELADVLRGLVDVGPVVATDDVAPERVAAAVLHAIGW